MTKALGLIFSFITICLGLIFFAPSSTLKALEISALPDKEQIEAIYPAPLLKLDDLFSHHVIVVEKSTHKLYLYENSKGYPRFIKSFTMATGKNRGDKLSQGDLKTPEGIYQLTDFKSGKGLVAQYGKDGEIYGIGAFVLNYPNAYDSLVGKTGDGIWFHGTNDESRISKGLDSRGCVVTVNNDVKEISQYIELNNTPMVIVEDLAFLKKNSWDLSRAALEDTLNKWWKAWSDENLNEYMSYYHPQEFKDSVRGNYAQFKAYKGAVFSNPGKPIIKLNHFSILNFDKYAVVQFEQEYHSDKINDTGKKTLYLKKDNNYDWKIFSENFSKLQRPERLSSFTPTQRYFNN